MKKVFILFSVEWNTSYVDGVVANEKLAKLWVKEQEAKLESKLEISDIERSCSGFYYTEYSVYNDLP